MWASTNILGLALDTTVGMAGPFFFIDTLVPITQLQRPGANFELAVTKPKLQHDRSYTYITYSSPTTLDHEPSIFLLLRLFLSLCAASLDTSFQSALAGESFLIHFLGCMLWDDEDGLYPQFPFCFFS